MSRVFFGLIGIFAYLSIIAIGFGVPYIFMSYAIKYNLDFIIAGVVAAIAIIAAAGLGVVVTAILFGESRFFIEDKSGELEKLSIFRAQSRAMLEELDDVVSILKDIRDILRKVGE